MIDRPFFGEDATLHHVGLAVNSIRAVSPESEPTANEAEGVSLAFITLNGVTIELLEPLGDNSPISNSLRNGSKLQHLCYAVPDLGAALESCKAAGFHRLSRPKPEPVFDGRRTVWVFSKHFGLFELVEQGR